MLPKADSSPSMGCKAAGSRLRARPEERILRQPAEGHVFSQNVPNKLLYTR